MLAAVLLVAACGDGREGPTYHVISQGRAVVADDIHEMGTIAGFDIIELPEALDSLRLQRVEAFPNLSPPLVVFHYRDPGGS